MSRRGNQRESVLLALRAAGTGGVTNLQLNAICFRYGARIWELRREGYDIETKPEGESVFRFIYKGHKLRGQASLFQEARG